MFLLAPIALIPIVICLWILKRAYDEVEERHLTPFHQRAGLKQTDNTTLLISRYLSRSRRYRASTAMFFTLFGMVIWANVTDQLALNAFVLLFCLSGYFVGAVLAETYNFRPRFRGPSEASLTPRSVATYSQSRSHRHNQLLAALTVTVGIVCLFRDGVNVALAFTFPVLALATVIIIHLCERAVASRARPALPEDLRNADDAIRSIAIDSLRTAGLALGVTFLTWEIGVFGETTSSAKPAFIVLTTLGLAASIALLVRARRYVWPR